MAPFLALVNNLVEIHVDFYKLMGHRRPVPHAAIGIGYWTNVFDAYTRVSTLTNAWIYSFNTDGVKKHLGLYLRSTIAKRTSVYYDPYQTAGRSDYTHHIQHTMDIKISKANDLYATLLNKYKWILFIAIVCLAWCLQALALRIIPPEPEWASEFLRRQEYIEHEFADFAEDVARHTEHELVSLSTSRERPKGIGSSTISGAA